MNQQNYPSTGRPTTRQPAPVSATTQRRVQRSYAMEAQQRYNSADDKLYEGMLTCLGCVFGTLGSIPGCCFFPKYLMSDFLVHTKRSGRAM
jgi:hypothetical protein